MNDTNPIYRILRMDLASMANTCMCADQDMVLARLSDAGIFNFTSITCFPLVAMQSIIISVDLL